MGEESTFEIGNIVKPKAALMYSEDWALRDKLGEVVEVDTSADEVRYLVQFGCDCYDRYSPRLKDRRGWFTAKEIEFESLTWAPPARASFLFGGMGWHHIRYSKDPFDDTCVCMHAAHDGQEPPPATRRALVNIWGTVCDIDVCAEHEDLDGCRMDDVPYGERWRKKSRAS